MMRYRSRAKNLETSTSRHNRSKFLIAQLYKYVMLVVRGVSHNAMVKKARRDSKLRRRDTVKVQRRGDIASDKRR
jgi:hypothetical protein